MNYKDSIDQNLHQRESKLLILNNNAVIDRNLIAPVCKESKNGRLYTRQQKQNLNFTGRGGRGKSLSIKRSVCIRCKIVNELLLYNNFFMTAW